ncbi:hypothetical protein MTO96_011316 [Rhipicephalus appendiculatus]
MAADRADGPRDSRCGKKKCAGAGHAAPPVPVVLPPFFARLPTTLEDRLLGRLPLDSVKGSASSPTGTLVAKIFKRTLSQPPSTTKSAAGILPSATSKMTTKKRSLFSNSHCSPTTRPRDGTVNDATSTTSVSTVITSNRRALTPRPSLQAWGVSQHSTPR